MVEQWRGLRLAKDVRTSGRVWWEAPDYPNINLTTAKLNIAARFPVAFDPPLDTTI